MGSDLVSACVFCAGLLLGVDLPPAPGLQVEVGFSYATAARRYQIEPGRDDLSDVTPKFVVIGLGGARAAEAGLGADTPSAEWRLRVALAPSHDEQEQTPFSLQNTTAAGTGRYENFAIALRYPLGERDSLEAAADRRKHRATDLLDIEQERFLFSEQRQLSAERIDVGLGWRHRWPGLEAAVSGRYVRPAGSHATAGAFDLAGGRLDRRAQREPSPLRAPRLPGSGEARGLSRRNRLCVARHGAASAGNPRQVPASIRLLRRAGDRGGRARVGLPSGIEQPRDAPGPVGAPAVCGGIQGQGPAAHVLRQRNADADGFLGNTSPEAPRHRPIRPVRSGAVARSGRARGFSRHRSGGRGAAVALTRRKRAR